VFELSRLSDDSLLDRLQRAAFGYFLEACNPANGLIADRTPAGSPASIAVVGFALASYPVAVERGWMARSEAAARTLAALRFFWTSAQSDSPDATGYKGFYYHFLDMQTGRRVWRSELSPVDTTFLLAGMLTAAAYFTGATQEEIEIRELAESLYRRVEWSWMQNGATAVWQGWKPESGYLHYGWEGYSEAILLYVLGLASPTIPSPIPAMRHGRRPISGKISTATIFSTPGRCSSTNSRMLGSISSISRTASCARSDAITSRTAGARSRSSSNTPCATRRNLKVRARIAGLSRPAMARDGGHPGSMAAIAVSSAMPRAACPTDRTMGR
jgi:hypothetical protein